MKAQLWDLVRIRPYTQGGIRRCRCIRCGSPAVHQWNICADKNRYRPLCNACDIALNRMVLEWAGHPDVEKLMAAYARKLA